MKMATMMSNSANIMPGLESSNGGAKSNKSGQQASALCTKLVGIVSLSVFGGTFVLAKVILGLISVIVLS